MAVHKHAWNVGAAATACEALLDTTKDPHISSRSSSASSLQQDLFHEKRRASAETNTTDSSSPHLHDSTPPRLQPIICTGAEPIHPVHGPPKLLATEATPQNEVTFLPFSIEKYTRQNRTRFHDPLNPQFLCVTTDDVKDVYE